MLLSLSDELLVRVLSCCEPETLQDISLTCRRLHTITKQDWLWEAVLTSTWGGRPMCRVAQTWRAELLKRRRLVAKWTGKDRSISSISAPHDIGSIVKSLYLGKDQVVLVVAEAGMLRFEAGNKKRSVFYYSTRFSESAVLSACALGPKSQLLFGFSDGMLVVIDRVPEDVHLGWDQCNWYNLSSSGPCITDIQTTTEGPLVAVVGQRRQSETAASVTLYNLKTKRKVSSAIVPDYSTCLLNTTGDIIIPSHDKVKMIACNGAIQITDTTVYNNQQEQFELPNERVFTDNHRSMLVFQVSPNELIFFSPTDFMMTARVQVRQVERIEDVLVLAEVVIVAGDCCLVILDAVGGQTVAKRAFKPKGAVKLIYAEKGTIHVLNGSEVSTVTIKPQSSKKTVNPPKANKRELAKKNQWQIREGMSERGAEKQVEQLMEVKREKMNIEGLTEEEMIKMALLLSME